MCNLETEIVTFVIKGSMKLTVDPEWLNPSKKQMCA